MIRVRNGNQLDFHTHLIKKISTHYISKPVNPVLILDENIFICWPQSKYCWWMKCHKLEVIERDVCARISTRIWPPVVTTNLQPPPNNVARHQNPPPTLLLQLFYNCFLYLQKGSRFSASFGVGNYCIFSAHTVLILQYVYLMDQSC